MKYAKLVSLGLAVATISGYIFNFNNFNSRDGLIREGVNRLRNIAENFKKDLETLQSEYDALMGELNSTQNALEQARIKLQAIYQKITGNTWDESQGDILEFDFDTLIKDSDQYEHNVNGAEISKVLGIPEDSSTEDIINAINNLIETVASLEQQVTNLENQVSNLETEIQEYQTEQDSLVEEINGLKAKLDAATAEANAIIDGASQEEQEQLDYINQTLTELGGEAVEDNEVPEVPEIPEDPEVPEVPEVPERDEVAYQEAYNNLSALKLRNLVDAEYKPEYIEDTRDNKKMGYKIVDNEFRDILKENYPNIVAGEFGQPYYIIMSETQRAELDAFYNEFMAQQ